MKKALSLLYLIFVWMTSLCQNPGINYLEADSPQGDLPNGSHYFKTLKNIALTANKEPTFWSESLRSSGTDTTRFHTIIVLDGSGSMWGRVAGSTKIEAARTAVEYVLEEIDADELLGLVVYGHRKKGDCSDIELLVPVGGSRAEIKKAVNETKPTGMTPLTASIQFAFEQIKETKQPRIILVSDGRETCHKDPCTAAREMKESNPNLIIHVVAFDLNQKDTESIACISEETEGQMFQANDTESLSESLKLAIAQPADTEEIISEVTLIAPDSVPAGSNFMVDWTGPNNPSDIIAVVPEGATNSYGHNINFTKLGTPLSLLALMDVGPAEVLYITGISRQVLARKKIIITPVSANLDAPDTANAGRYIDVSWTGPNNEHDFIGIFKKGDKEGKWPKNYTKTKKGTPLKVLVPMEPGEYEIRYASGQDRRTLGHIDLLVEVAEVSLNAQASANAGRYIDVSWTGPNNEHDFIGIFKKGDKEGKWPKNYTKTKKGTPLKVLVPMEPGEYEIRYASGQDRKTLLSRPLKVLPKD